MDSNGEDDFIEEQNWVLDTDEDFDSLAMLEINRTIQERYERAIRTGNLDSESESDFDDDDDDDSQEMMNNEASKSTPDENDKSNEENDDKENE